MEQNSIIRMPDFPTVWEANCPETLFDTVVKFCINHPQTMFDIDIATGEYKLKDNIALHQAICHRMVELASLEENTDKADVRQVIQFFSDPTRTRLTRANLSYSKVTDKEIKILCRHAITDLKLYKCPNLTAKSMIYISKMPSLVSLDIGKTDVFQLCPDKIDSGTNPLNPADLTANPTGSVNHACSVCGSKEPCQHEETHAINSVKLVQLKMEKCVGQNQIEPFQLFVKNLPFLTHLDLSRCEHLGDLSCLANKPQLTSLVLYNVRSMHLCFPTIRTLHSLRHLDISSAAEWHVFFDKPNPMLQTLVESLKNLESLDISGTNLAGDRIQERIFPQSDTTHDPRFLGSRLKEARTEHNPNELDVTDIPGLISRVGRPLEYLGLYNTPFDACHRHHIPAKRIGGEANEDQILMAAQMNVTRIEVIQKVLNDLFHVFRFSTCTNVQLALDVVLHAMNIHMMEKHIQISGSASLFYIVKGEEKEQFNPKIKQKIIKTLLNGMLQHITDVTMLRNGCLSLIHFKIPEDVVCTNFFEYKRLVTLLLRIVSATDQDEFVQRVGVYLLNSLACQVDNSQKLFVGDAGAISIMLDLIRNRLSSTTCDEVMETAWSTMWNVTDETPVNCERFLEQNGMLLFLGCLEAFPAKAELLRNMMGLLGNVAEVKELRCHLMEDQYISVFSDLLNSKCDGIEVSYNAAGILSHIASDGPDLWAKHNISTVNRQAVLDRMVNAIQSWNLTTKRNINYRSFEPILRLLEVEHTPEAQLWAVWALANLTNVYPEKYCSVLEEEGGLDMIVKLNYHSNLMIQQLAHAIIAQCTKYKKSRREGGVDIASGNDLLPFPQL